MNSLQKIFFLTLIIAGACPAFAAPPVRSADVAFVDFRQLLLNHPIFQQFDTATRRFKNTSSAWVADPKAAIERYDAEIAALAAERLKITEEFKAAVQQKKQSESPSIFAKSVWDRLSVNTVKRAALESAREALLQGSNYRYDAATGIQSLHPIIETIARDIKSVCLALNAKYGLPIIDISCFQRPVSAPNRLILSGNTHSLIWRGNPTPAELSLWLAEYRKHLRKTMPQRFSQPFYQGALDLRQEALSSMTFSSNEL